MKRLVNQKHGFTVIEAAIALAIGTAFLTSAVSTWYASSKIWNGESLRSKLRYNIVKSMEQIKNDVRLSNGNGILFYPSANASTYTALSIPAATADANGFFTLTQSGINWNKTVIYHVFTNSSTGAKELRKTIFNSYNSDQTARQTQLDNVVAAGTDAGATTTTLFSANDVTVEITSQNPTFDGYASSVQSSSITSFGSIPLSAGNHQIRFEITGRNTASTGYGAGIDMISLNPSGSPQEAESLSIVADSGKPKVQENNALWSGNTQVEYQATGVGDFVTFQTYYDQWLESNFANMSHSNTSVTGTNPALSLLSREDQSLTPAWQASAQTQGALPGDASNQSFGDNSIRTIISGASVTRSGQMARIKFTAGSGAGLNIGAAYFGVRNGATPNFLGSVSQLFFDNAAVAEGDPDPVGAMNPGSNTGISIPAGRHAWSNWFNYTIDTQSGVPDFLVSLYVSGGSGIAWTPNPPGSTQSYQVNGDNAGSVADWTGLAGYQENPGTFAATDLSTWISSGTATSQIYDTKLTAPSFQQLTWSSVLPQGSTVSMKVRTSDNPDMSGATSWGALANYASSPADLSGLSKARYVQFQTMLQAASPYSSYPQVDDVKITWPGQTALVEISGNYAKKPGYGIFKVLVDGQNTVENLSVKVTASDLFQGKTLSHSLTAQARPRNTGK